MVASTALNNHPSPNMTPTISSADRWIARKALLQARQKRFLRAAAILHWMRLVGVAGALWGLYWVMVVFSEQTWIRLGFLLIAIASLWTDVHYEAKRLRRRAMRQEMTRKYRRAMQKHSR